MSPTKLTGGHTNSVLCVDIQVQTGQVVSGSEGGELCVWTHEGQLKDKLIKPDVDCTSVVFSQENPNVIYAAFGEEVLILDTQRLQDPVYVFHSNQDEINQVTLDSKEQFLAACDDSGEIKVFGLQDRKVFKTLRHKHTNICSTAIFRPGRQWEIVSGGLDCRLVHWDFSKPKCLNQFNMQELHATPGDTPYMINPPFVHHMATSSSGSILACALENGQIPIFNGSQKNLQSKFALFGHVQGVSQVHFLTDDILLSAGNDACINQWDLTKADLYEPAAVYMNGNGGHANPEDDKNLAISELCKMRTLSHPSKVNWMIPYRANNEQILYVADQTADITLLDLS
ncbi:unnamed protein product [Lymnaea stagnalis]|uniref:WD repeat-containing protein 53 n=1 Tax=Lymnaea stagnalis TaxID=6523 RepID=A0AAV2I0T6_LYMST